MKIKILIIFFLFTNIISQEVTYEALKRQGSEYINPSSLNDKDLELETELKNEKPISPSLIGKFWCDPSIKLNTVRQDVMTNMNYNKLLYRYKYFILYVTTTWCDYCCQHEKELLSVKQILLDKTYEGEEIPIVQIQSDIDLDAIKELKLGFFKVPTLYFVKEKQFIQYNSFWKANNIIRFINNILNPVVELHTVEDVEKFFDTNKNFEEKNDFLGHTVLDIPEETDHHYRNRMIGFFSDIDDYSAQYSMFYSYAEKISHRPDLRLGIITDKEIVKHFKDMYDGIWFNSHSWNSIVLKRINNYMFLDLSLLSEHLETFMIYNTVPWVDELNNNNNFITQKIATPVALFFIDSTFIIPNYHSTLKFLINLSKKYVAKYVFMFMDGNTRSKSKEHLGLKKESPLPTLVINYIASQKNKQMPFDKLFNDIEIKKFLDQNYLSKLTGTDLDDLKEKNLKSFDDKIIKNIKLATKIDKKNYDKITGNNKFDVVLFIIDSDYDDLSANLSKYINKICNRFKSLGIKSVLFTVYDMNESGIFNEKGIDYKKGDIYLFPANSKTPSKYGEKLTLLRLMKWIEKNSDIKMRLPDIPHIALELQEEYYKKKTVLENYEENLNKNDLELDELVGMDFEVMKSNENQIKSDF